ncbi:TonB-dependent receptor [Phenylobacterium montanum]|uniref:TonB-dependent receptor n=1 Tax=Phenylobacterium montanum TaxID=2823693 RepID=A0A975G2W5_9CAUL|nr:TonB-dependent receptor [Caulobacter sp. S6]QUD89502.1 TonB-dependent receptor [Caulobacter sp. S6]
MAILETRSAHCQRSRWATFLATSTSAFALAMTANAAQPAQNSKVEEIVVTANRSGAESLQKVAAAISAVNIQQVDQSGAGNLVDLAKFTPSLSITQGAPGYNKFDMRGLTTGPYAGSDTSDRSLVAVYLDDTPISVQGQTPDLRVYDLERVEILRGPQGTLYGASSMAGTIRFVTAKPSLTKTFGSLEVTGGATEHGQGSYSLRGMFNTPLANDQLALRGTIYTGEDGGYIDNIGLRDKKDANRNRSTQGRLALRWRPNDRFTADLSATVEESRAYGLNSVLSGLPAYTTSTNSSEGTSDDLQLFSLNLDYDLGRADLISTTSYTWRRLGYDASIESTIGYFFQDYGTGLPVGPGAYPLFEEPSAYSQEVADSIPAEHFKIDNKIQDVMQEVRLVSKDDGPVKWTVGLFFEHQQRNLYQDIPVPGFDTLSYQNTFYGPFNTPNGLYNSQTVDHAFNPNDIFSGLQNLEERQIAIYTDDTWHVTPKLDLTAGVRYFSFRENYYLFEGGVYGVVNHVPLTLNAVQKADGFNPRFNAAYHVNPDLMIYAEAAKGFRYGGANQPVPIGSSGIAGQCAQELAAYGYSSAPLTFGPDHLWNYSIGEKARLFDGRMTLNADAFYIDWKDVQTRLGLNCSYFFTDNKGAITSKGFEAEATIRLTPELTLSSNLSYTDATANGDLVFTGAFNGDQTPYFPKWIGSVFLFYDRPLGDGKLHAQISYQYRGEEHTTFNDYSTALVNGVLTRTGPSASYAVIPAQNNVGASIAYDFGRYEFGVYGTNLTDGVKITDIVRATYYAPYQAGNLETAARPRSFGVRIKASF